MAVNTEDKSSVFRWTENRILWSKFGMALSNSVGGDGNIGNHEVYVTDTSTKTGNVIMAPSLPQSSSASAKEVEESILGLK